MPPHYLHLEFPKHVVRNRQTFPGPGWVRLMRLMSGWNRISRLSASRGWFQPHGRISRIQPRSAEVLWMRRWIKSSTRRWM